MDALAITDHGVMFGVMEFYFECKKKGIRPIIGVEAYVAPQGHKVKRGDGEKSAFHLLLLAKDLEGYKNLCKLSTVAALEGYYYKPRIDHELLRAHAKGLIGTSACLGSEICQFLLKGNYDEAQRLAGMYDEIFGHGNFFIELQDHGIPEQRELTESLVRISRELDLPLVATNDAHYLCKTDAEPHDVLLCIQTGEIRQNEKRFKFPTSEFYLKSPEEMEKLFHEYPSAIENSLRVAEMCSLQLDKRRAPMPEPVVPEGMDSFQFLRDTAEAGLRERIKEPELALARLNYELDVIEKTGFGDYFLLVREFAQTTREKGIYFGVRGSAAGSLVSYCLGITDVDPLEYDLTFERFLNPERISMPDIDMDFEDARRDEVIQYVNERFGQDHVAQIVTFGTLGPKAAIKDAGRVMGYTPQETDRICKTIPTLPGWTLDKAYSELKEFQAIIDGDSRFKNLFDTAKSVEGLARHAGVHAAGVVISRDPLVDYVPLYRGNDGQPVTAFEMGILEKIGLLKMDFLGLSNLTVLAQAVRNIEARTGEPFDIRSIPNDDANTFEMLGRGETIGVFQLEGGGMTKWVTQLRPSSIRELAAMIALYRPGPMEHIPRFIGTKFGKLKPESLDPRMDSILEETYGVIVYQDQVLRIVQAIAGFSLGKADILRRAMGKKDLQAMRDMKLEFMEGALAHELSEQTAERIWELLLPFAGYAFNKAHAVCYSILAYQTAFLKANYPLEYMAALLSVYLSREDKVTAFIEECRRMKIRILPPSVNESQSDFSIDETQQAIRFGLLAIKGVGSGVIETILRERQENGPYRHLFEFAERVKASGLNRVALEALVRSGAFDPIDRNRRKLMDRVEAALQFADQKLRDKLAGQDSLFGGDGPNARPEYPPLPDCDLASRTDILSWEKETMGIYVSDHPLRGLEQTLKQAATHSCIEVDELEEGTHVRLAGVVAQLRTMVTKRTGEKMASLVLEDFSGQVSGLCFPKSYERVKDNLTKDAVVQVAGFVVRDARSEGKAEIRIDELKPLEGTLELSYAPHDARVRIAIDRATPAQLRALRQAIERFPGDHVVEIQVLPTTEYVPLTAALAIDPTNEFIMAAKEAVPSLNVAVVTSRF